MSSTSLKTDPLLSPFTNSTFSATAYLNDTLPSLPSTTPTTKSALPSLASLTSQTQSQISTLSAQTARLSTTLTALTDDILRSSSRLAYEVELLRGEASSLIESLDGDPTHDLNLTTAITKFASPALAPSSSPPLPPPSSSPEPLPLPTSTKSDPGTPHETLSHLRTLLHVRTLLLSTTHTFNAALSFPLPPSLLHTTSSLISITAPTAAADTDALEQRGQAALAALRREISSLLATGDEEAARARVAELRETVRVWKGTGEEKARGKVVDELEGMLEEGVGRKKTQGGSGLGEMRAQDGGAGRGFLGGLQRLREGVYMD